MATPAPKTKTKPAPEIKVKASASEKIEVDVNSEELKALKESNALMAEKLEEYKLAEEEAAKKAEKESADLQRVNALKKVTKEFRSNTPNSRYITRSGQELTFRASAEKIGTNEDGTTAETVFGVFFTAAPGLIKELTELAKSNSAITAR